MTDTTSIDERIDRVEEIIERLESESLSLSEATALREEGDQILDALREDLEVGDGSVTELE